MIIWKKNSLFDLLQGHHEDILGFSFDTRSLKKGDAFLALKGQNVDGHNFIKDALKKGASCVITQRAALGNDCEKCAKEILKCLEKNENFDAIQVLKNNLKKNEFFEFMRKIINENSKNYLNSNFNDAENFSEKEYLFIVQEINKELLKIEEFLKKNFFYVDNQHCDFDIQKIGEFFEREFGAFLKKIAKEKGKNFEIFEKEDLIFILKEKFNKIGEFFEEKLLQILKLAIQKISEEKLIGIVKLVVQKISQERLMLFENELNDVAELIIQKINGKRSKIDEEKLIELIKKMGEKFEKILKNDLFVECLNENIIIFQKEFVKKEFSEFIIIKLLEKIDENLYFSEKKLKKLFNANQFIFKHADEKNSCFETELESLVVKNLIKKFAENLKIFEEKLEEIFNKNDLNFQKKLIDSMIKNDLKGMISLFIGENVEANFSNEDLIENILKEKLYGNFAFVIMDILKFSKWLSFFKIKNNKKSLEKFSEKELKKIFVVDSVMDVLEKIAIKRRSLVKKAKIISINGSVGKTTTKRALKMFLEQKYKVDAPINNYNNHLGICFFLAQIDLEADFLLFEIAMNNKNEIAKLAKLVRPDYSIITHIATTHADNMTTLFATLEEKADILPETSKKAYFSDDFWYSNYLKNKCEENNLEFKNFSGSSSSALIHLKAAWKAILEDFDVEFDENKLPEMTGRKDVFEVFLNGYNVKIIDSTYNATFISMIEEINFAKSFEGTKKFVLADMKTIGRYSQKYHKELVEILKNEELFLYGSEMKKANGSAFENLDDLFENLVKSVNKDCVVLFKGSNSMNLGELINRLKKI